MRLVATFSKPEQANAFSELLSASSIDNICEVADSKAEVWIVEEDQLEEAMKLREQFLADPNSPALRAQSAVPPDKGSKREPRIAGRRAPFRMGKATTVLLLLCILFFFLTGMGYVPFTHVPKYIEPFFGMDSPLAAGMLYDLPRHYELEQQILNQLNSTQMGMDMPPPNLLPLVSQMRATPYFHGFYDDFLTWYHNRAAGWPTAPMFEKISQGEVWRLVTPIFLHGNILHILFNMLWLVIVGAQVEKRLGVGRYLLLSLLGAAIPNTVQYLMGGPFFIGYSGVITTLVGYIWARQARAPWEGYLLGRATLLFVGIYVAGLFVLQFVAFIVALSGKQWALATGIANTAHITGGILGYLLGSWERFSERVRR